MTLLELFCDVDDRKPVPKLVKRLFGTSSGDKRYLSHAMFDSLLDQGVQLIMGVRANMKNHLLVTSDKLRSAISFVISVVAGVIANNLRGSLKEQKRGQASGISPWPAPFRVSASDCCCYTRMMLGSTTGRDCVSR
ncbi:MAG: transposase [Pleurocapsa minor GSE-CHR-MK-17-07R]|jgi:hypothetical protein|nr:transposase [Pleurocapsa minor GSE-CHR-MK 17-07R]